MWSGDCTVWDVQSRWCSWHGTWYELGEVGGRARRAHGALVFDGSMTGLGLGLGEERARVGIRALSASRREPKERNNRVERSLNRMRAVTASVEIGSSERRVTVHQS